MDPGIEEVTGKMRAVKIYKDKSAKYLSDNNVCLLADFSTNNPV